MTHTLKTAVLHYEKKCFLKFERFEMSLCFGIKLVVKYLNLQVLGRH